MRPHFILAIEENKETQKMIHDGFLNTDIDQAKRLVTTIHAGDGLSKLFSIDLVNQVMSTEFYFVKICCGLST